MNKHLILIVILCFSISLSWHSTYHLDEHDSSLNHCCAEMTDEVSEVFTVLHIPHKKVQGMYEYNPKYGVDIGHAWIMIETPLGEIPFESTFLVPAPFFKKYYNYSVIEKNRGVNMKENTKLLLAQYTDNQLIDAHADFLVVLQLLNKELLRRKLIEQPPVVCG